MMLLKAVSLNLKNYVKNNMELPQSVLAFKGCVRCIFASLFFKSKREHLSN